MPLICLFVCPMFCLMDVSVVRLHWPLFSTEFIDHHKSEVAPYFMQINLLSFIHAVFCMGLLFFLPGALAWHISKYC